MADGLRLGTECTTSTTLIDSAGGVDKQLMAGGRGNQEYQKLAMVRGNVGVSAFLLQNGMERCEFSGVGQMSKEDEEDCRKKRCVDRYDSSESSDSGVAVLSCTDCSGSSTSSDITDPGSPFSTTSNHSDDSSPSNVGTMPPTQNHHPPWPWNDEQLCNNSNSNNIKRECGGGGGLALVQKTEVFPTKSIKQQQFDKTKKLNDVVNDNKQLTSCLLNNSLSSTSNNNNQTSNRNLIIVAPTPSPMTQTDPVSQRWTQAKKTGDQLQTNPIKQVKITEYFKSQMKLHAVKKPLHAKEKTDRARALKRAAAEHAKVKRPAAPRKILPAPLKAAFAPTVTLAALAFPGVAYVPRRPDVFVQQFALAPPAFPLALAGFAGCAKVGAAMVPLVKLGAAAQLVAEGGVKEAEGGGKDAVAAAVEDSSDSGIASVRGRLELEVDIECGTAGTLPAEQKSPILSQPKTIRFPAPASLVKVKCVVKDEAKTQAQREQESGLCKWAQCNAQFDTSGALLEHLQVKHVISQAAQEQYVCLWLGCKVHGRTSCSRSWLERHVLAHAGTKPFRCIVDGCGQRFNSQLTLERHVNGHFTGDGNQSNNAKKTTDTSSTKLFKRNGKKIRFRRQPWSARMFDFIDSGIMEGLQHKLLRMTQDRTMGQIHNAGDTVDVSSQVVAKRVESDGRSKYLVRWQPTNILPDEWIWENEYVTSKSVLIPSLQPSAKDALNSCLFNTDTSTTTINNNHYHHQQRRKRCRKSIAKQQT